MRAALQIVVIPLVASCGVNANLITNGGFESGFFGWTRSPLDGYSGISNVGPHSGAKSAWFGEPTGFTYLSQMIPTIPGETYITSFWAANNAGGTPQNEIQVFWDGIQKLDAVNVGTVGWTHMQGTVTATKPLTQIEFAFNNGPGWFNLDDVSVVATPEPATLPLAGMALLALAVTHSARRGWG